MFCVPHLCKQFFGKHCWVHFVTKVCGHFRNQRKITYLLIFFGLFEKKIVDPIQYFFTFLIPKMPFPKRAIKNIEKLIQ
jgi:hypothetical protein